MSRRGLARLNARRDANERPIIETLQARGYSVFQISGKGIPDLLVSKNGSAWLVEVKMPKGRWKPAQVTFRERWTGPPLHLVRSTEDAWLFPAQTLTNLPAVGAVDPHVDSRERLHRATRKKGTSL